MLCFNKITKDGLIYSVMIISQSQGKNFYPLCSLHVKNAVKCNNNKDFMNHKVFMNQKMFDECLTL